MVTAWGPSLDQSALGIRLRGYSGPIDAELVFAKRATDYMYGVTSSAAIGDFEMHGEFAAFQNTRGCPFPWAVRKPQPGPPKPCSDLSNNFNIGTGLKVLMEYHYSGFGASDPKIAAFTACYTPVTVKGFREATRKYWEDRFWRGRLPIRLMRDGTAHSRSCRASLIPLACCFLPCRGISRKG